MVAFLNKSVVYRSLLIVIFYISLIYECASQQLSGHYYYKLEVESNSTIEITTDSLYIDTLILGDNGKLRFMKDGTILIVEHAYIGNDCVFDGTGISGSDANPVQYLNEDFNGFDGQDGFDLKLIIIFRSLGILNIITAGGNGGKGAKGRDGLSGQSGTIGNNNGDRGENGGNGGDGGDGGDVQLHYICVNFTPRFNSNGRKNIINFNLAGGKGGSGGIGGRGGRGGEPIYQETQDSNGKLITTAIGVKGMNGSQGFLGSSGKNGKDGELLLKTIPE